MIWDELGRKDEYDQNTLYKIHKELIKILLNIYICRQQVTDLSQLMIN